MAESNQKLNLYVIEYLQSKRYRSSSLAFLDEIDVVDDQGEIKVVHGLLEEQWGLFCLETNKRSYSQEATTARLNGQLFDYMQSQGFEKSAAAFELEAPIIKGPLSQAEFFSNFWIPRVDQSKFSVSLSRREVASDIMAMTGKPLPPKPKKRPRAVQRQLDTLFPGLGLGQITPNLYEVPDEIDTVKASPEANKVRQQSIVTRSKRESKLPKKFKDYEVGSVQQEESTQKNDDLQPGPLTRGKKNYKNLSKTEVIQPSPSTRAKRVSRKLIYD